MRKITVVGSKKMIVFDDMEAAEKIRIYDKGFDVAEAEFVNDEQSLRIRNGDILIPRIDDAEPLRLECAQFVRSIRTGVPPRTDSRDGLRVVEVLAAADASLKSEGHPFPVGSAQDSSTINLPLANAGRMAPLSPIAAIR
jgi:predicted dehydrogenase